MRTTTNGTKVISFGVAVNDPFKKGPDGKMEADFFDCKAFGKTAELIQQHFAKGDPIYIHGRASQDTWEDKEGKSRSRIIFIANHIDFPMAKKTEGKNGETRQAQPQKVNTAVAVSSDDGEDNEIPF